MTTERTALGGGTVLILLGALAWVLSRVVDSGFVHGLFLGMTVALMLLGALAVGRGLRSGVGSEDGPDWLPSRDHRE